MEEKEEKSVVHKTGIFYLLPSFSPNNRREKKRKGRKIFSLVWFERIVGKEINKIKN